MLSDTKDVPTRNKENSRMTVTYLQTENKIHENMCDPVILILVENASRLQHCSEQLHILLGKVL